VKKWTYRPRIAVSSIIIPKDAGGQSQNYQNHPWRFRNRILLFPYPFNPDSMYCPQKRNNNPYSVHELLVEVSCCTLKLPKIAKTPNDFEQMPKKGHMHLKLQSNTAACPVDYSPLAAPPPLAPCQGVLVPHSSIACS
jgi:hypothetical protein